MNISTTVRRLAGAKAEPSTPSDRATEVRARLDAAEREAEQAAKKIAPLAQAAEEAERAAEQAGRAARSYGMNLDLQRAAEQARDAARDAQQRLANARAEHDGAAGRVEELKRDLAEAVRLDRWDAFVARRPELLRLADPSFVVTHGRAAATRILDAVEVIAQATAELEQLVVESNSAAVELEAFGALEPGRRCSIPSAYGAIHAAGEERELDRVPVQPGDRLPWSRVVEELVRVTRPTIALHVVQAENAAASRLRSMMANVRARLADFNPDAHPKASREFLEARRKEHETRFRETSRAIVLARAAGAADDDEAIRRVALDEIARADEANRRGPGGSAA